MGLGSDQVTITLPDKIPDITNTMRPTQPTPAHPAEQVVQMLYVPPAGFEPATYPLGTWVQPLGAPGRIRTCDLPFRRGLLYPLSYGGQPVSWSAPGLGRVYRVRPGLVASR